MFIGIVAEDMLLLIARFRWRYSGRVAARAASPANFVESSSAFALCIGDMFI